MQSKILNFSRTDICTVGDSNTDISFFGEPEPTAPKKRWSYIIGQNLGMSVRNVAIGGATTEDFLQGGQYGEWRWREPNAKYYIICFGLNDEKDYSTSIFEEKQRELIHQIQTHTRGIPILMTNVWVDYPEHYSYDRNTQKIKPYDDIKRSIASDLGLHLIDVYQRFKDEHDNNGVWDTRIRTTDVWDDSQDDGKTVDSGWFDNIHYNIQGNQIVADEITKYFQNNIL